MQLVISGGTSIDVEMYLLCIFLYFLIFYISKFDTFIFRKNKYKRGIGRQNEEDESKDKARTHVH